MWLHNPDMGHGANLICLETGARIHIQKQNEAYEVVIVVNGQETILYKAHDERPAKEAFYDVVNRLKDRDDLYELKI